MLDNGINLILISHCINQLMYYISPTHNHERTTNGKGGIMNGAYNEPAGHIITCDGLTVDERIRIFETVHHDVVLNTCATSEDNVIETVKKHYRVAVQIITSCQTDRDESKTTTCGSSWGCLGKTASRRNVYGLKRMRNVLRGC